jgi:hypothetical protein
MKSENSFREIGLLVLILVVIGAATAIIITTFRGRISGVTAITITPYATTPVEEPTTEVPYPYPNTLPLYYSTPDLAATQTAAGPLATQDMIRYATQMAITPSPTPPVTYPPTGTYVDFRTLSSGVQNGLNPQNGWFGLFNERPVNILAGSLVGDKDQGVIFIFMQLPERGYLDLIKTPTRHGAVHVVSEQDDRLTLVSTDGTTYYFDLPARRFVASMTGVVPSATPLPTYTPFPPPSFIGIPTPYPAPSEQSTAAP